MNILGIDYGRKKIGLAIGDSRTGLAEPLKTITNRPLVELADLIKEYQIDLFVLGLPEGKIIEEILDFGKKLEKKFSLPVKFSDETLSTLDARKILGKIKRSRQYQKKMEDATAAAVMLELYLERQGKNV